MAGRASGLEKLSGRVICLEPGAHLHMAQLMLLPLTVSCSSKIQIGFTSLVPAHPGSPGQRAVKRACVLLTNLNCAAGLTGTRSIQLVERSSLLVCCICLRIVTQARLPGVRPVDCNTSRVGDTGRLTLDQSSGARQRFSVCHFTLRFNVPAV